MGFIEVSYGGNVTLSNVDIDSDLNLKNEYDLIGVKRLVCQDYLGALVGSASNTVRKTISIDITGEEYSEKIRIPSNFVPGSVVRVQTAAVEGTNSIDVMYHVSGAIYRQLYYNVNNQKVVATASGCYVYVYKYDEVDDSYTLLGNLVLNGTTVSGNIKYLDVSVSGGEYICIKTESKTISFTANKSETYYLSGSEKITPGENTTVSVTANSSVNSSLSVLCDMTVYTDPNAIWD